MRNAIWHKNVGKKRLVAGLAEVVAGDCAQSNMIVEPCANALMKGVLDYLQDRANPRTAHHPDDAAAPLLPPDGAGPCDVVQTVRALSLQGEREADAFSPPL
ncbi:MAG: hypothetical protein K1X78_00020 [Verrucomicrobiaceae bacterium]|nr:hypothetical protein [Verrucomicrobiaceae bacterium]